MGILSVKGALVAACSVASTFAAPAEFQLDARAFPDAPDGYSPKSVDCPSTRPTIRSGNGLSSNEVAWLPKRRNATITPIREFLSRAAIPDFDSDAYLSGVETDATALPNIGLAFSGGGYRAMTQGAGAMAACDSRTDGSTASGHIGGLLQSATYVAGLSGGGWLVGSLAMNNFSSVQSIRDKNYIWQLDQTILEGPDNGPSLLTYWSDVADAVSGKKDAGFERSLTDYWGRTLSYQLIEPETGGVSFTWSSIADDSNFKDGDQPMPILVADGRYEGETIISINTTVYEFNPWEMGSWDHALNAFAPMEYVGSAWDGGELPDNETCVRGFDNAGFVMGTSSSLFNQIILYINGDSPLVPEGIPDFVISALADILTNLGEASDDIADWSPNPFYGYESDHNLNADQRSLTLVDGGEDLQNIPYYPLIQDKRDLDVVFSFDASADTDTYWPNGTAPIATYMRSLDPISNGTSFPAVPDYNTFVNLGLNSRPTFFGCDAANATASGADRPAPLIVYVPSYPYVHFANLSTFGTLSLTNTERDAMIQNGYETATMANSTREADWQVCVACAMMHRSWVRTGTDVPAKCSECFDTFCWDGTLNTTVPVLYEPELYGQEVDTQDSAASALTHVGLGSVFALAAWLVL